MNRGDLRTSLTSRLGIPATGDGLLTTTALNECIDLALRDISDAGSWPWLLSSASVTFTAGVAAFPTGVQQPRELTVGGVRAKKASSLPEFLDRLADGALCVWFPVGTNVKLAPVPATAPTTAALYFQLSEPALAADGDSPLLPALHHNVLLARAAYHANMRRQKFDGADRAADEYETGLRRMLDAQRATTGPRRIRPAGSTMWAAW